MARNFSINGECLVKVKGGRHLTGAVSGLVELGLTSDAIHIIPKFYHEDFHCDDFGPNVPPEVMWNLAEVRISMTLVHFDQTVLNTCVSESMGGGTEGIIQGAGTTLGRYVAPLASGCHYISLNLLSPQLNRPWRFPTTYLAEPPKDLPIGTERSLIRLNWRAIPYASPQFIIDPDNPDFPAQARTEITSSGIQLWSHVLDT